MKKQYLIPSQWNVAVAACLFAIANIMPTAHAEPTVNTNFELNFQNLNATPFGLDIYCMPGVAYSADSCVRGQAGIDPDQTPFLLERFINASDGLGYYHVLIGDPDSTFSQEYYIGYAGGGAKVWANWGFRMNYSAGSYNGGNDIIAGGYDWQAPLDSDPTKSGNGTGRPDRVVFRQTLQGDGFSQEVLKSSFLNKPKITQTVKDGVNGEKMLSTFVLDMSALGYSGTSALTTAGTMTNTMVVTDTQSGWVVTDFDANTSSQNSYVTGGKYSYTNGPAIGGSYGTYTYTPGAGFNVYNVDWAAYLDTNDPSNFDYTNSIPNY